MTQVQLFRDRWEMGHIGTVIFILQALMLVPYIIIGVMGGGETLSGVSQNAVPYWLGGAIVALVVMSYVFFGGMRGTAWVNSLQTIMFLVFGTIAFAIIAHGMGGFGKTVQNMVDTLDQARASAATRPAAAPRQDPAVAPTGEMKTDPALPGSVARAVTTAPTPPPPPGAVLIRGKVNPDDPNAQDRIAKGYYLSYALIPLSSIMFPHIAIFCLTAKKLSSFRKTVILYPLCILAIWLPAVFLGAIASSQPKVIAATAAGAEEIVDYREGVGGAKKPKLVTLLEASPEPKAKELAARIAPGQPPIHSQEFSDLATDLKAPPIRAELRRLANTNADGVMLDMLTLFAPAILAGILGAAIMACVMASDSQILALSTMWAEDVYRFYGGTSGARQIWSARIFVVVITIAAYIIALAVHKNASIFELAIQYAFSGYASMAPIMYAALFWKRSTKWGALAATLWIAASLIIITVIQARTTHLAPATPVLPPSVIFSIGDYPIMLREYNRISFTEHRFLMVVPMFLGTCLAVIIASLLTKPPSQQTLTRYFPPRKTEPVA
jgi:Na+/proline symporter